MFTRFSRSPLFQYYFLHLVPSISLLKPNPPSHSFCPIFRNVSSSCLLAPLVLLFSRIDAFAIRSLLITPLKRTLPCTLFTVLPYRVLLMFTHNSFQYCLFYSI